MNECKSDDEAKNREKVFWFCWLKSSSFHINFMALFFRSDGSFNRTRRGREKPAPTTERFINKLFHLVLDGFPSEKKFFLFCVFFFWLILTRNFRGWTAEQNREKRGKHYATLKVICYQVSLKDALSNPLPAARAFERFGIKGCPHSFTLVITKKAQQAPTKPRSFF